MARRRRRRNPSRARRRVRRNPAGGWLPAIGGFLAVPIATHLAVVASSRVVPVTDDRSLMNRTQVADVGAAVLSWAGRDRIRDPGWRSFVTGGMYASIIAAVLRPVAYAMIAARGSSAQLPVSYPNDGAGVAPYVPPPPRLDVRPVVQEEDEGYDVPPVPAEVVRDEGYDDEGVDPMDLALSFIPGF